MSSPRPRFWIHGGRVTGGAGGDEMNVELPGNGAPTPAGGLLYFELHGVAGEASSRTMPWSLSRRR